MDYVECQFNKTMVTNSSCKLSFITRLTKALTLKMTPIKPIDNLRMHFKLFYRFRTGWRIFLVNISENYCDYVTEKNLKSKALEFLLPSVKNHSNQMLQCPWVTPYIMEKMPIDGRVFQYPFVPVGQYYLNVTETCHDVWIWSGQFHFTIPEGRSIENDNLGR